MIKATVVIDGDSLLCLNKYYIYRSVLEEQKSWYYRRNKIYSKISISNIADVFKSAIHKVGIPRDFWVQNTQYFKLFIPNNISYNERILVGPGSHSPELKTTKGEYLWHVQRYVVFHWCSFKILLNQQLQNVNIKIFWLSIDEILTRF